jgi:hypothetical protein
VLLHFSDNKTLTKLAIIITYRISELSLKCSMIHIPALTILNIQPQIKQTVLSKRMLIFKNMCQKKYLYGKKISPSKFVDKFALQYLSDLNAF